MKRVINELIYDTDTANFIMRVILAGETTLWRTDNGNWFLSTATSDYGPEKIEPLTKSGAMNFLILNSEVLFKKYFPDAQLA